MSSRPRQFRPSFLLTGALVAFGLVTAFALLSSRSATRVVQQQANARGQDVASHVASLVSLYLRERHQELQRIPSGATRSTEIVGFRLSPQVLDSSS